MLFRWIFLFLLTASCLQGQLFVGGKTFVRSPSELGTQGEWVLYEKNAPQDESNRRWLTKRVLVELGGATMQSLAQLPGVTKTEARGAYAVVTFAGDPAVAISGAKQLRRVAGVRNAEPMLARQLQHRFVPNDPLFAYNVANPGYQWHLRNTGQNEGVAGVDLNVVPAWDNYKGTGIRIGILDDGMEVAHPDLAPNADTANDRDFNDLDNDPTPSAGDYHGTACAGVAAARGNNSLGVSGVAPEAMLVGMRLIAAPTTDDVEADAFAFKKDIIQVKSNSWGPFDNAYGASGPGPLSKAALADAATTGRGGKGSVFLWAGGNGNANGDDSNYDGWAASPYAIAVGAIGDDGESVWYGEPGANLLVCAPSNGGKQSITTTDRVGSTGYSSGDYTSTFGGTSSSTPAVAGVVALMLQANANLTYRDVQEILMRTATTNDPNNGGWVTNGAGFDFHHSYGSGLVNAQAATAMAATWTSLAPRETRTAAATGLPLAIPDGGSAGLTQSFTVANADNLRLEHVTVSVKATHPYRGQLEWWLTSPSGVRSRLARSRGNDTGANLDWTFMSTHFWGERSEGTWKLQVYDTDLADAGTLEEATITFYGTPASSVLPPPIITSNLIVVGREGASMDYQITASNFPSSYGAIGLPPGISINTSTGHITGTPTGILRYDGYLLATNTASTTFENAIFYILPADPDLSTAVEQPSSLKIVPFGYGDWFRQTVIKHDGVDAAQSGAVDHDEYSGIEFTVVGPTRMTYQWKVSSEQNYDYLVMVVDGYVKAYITGEVDWTEVTQDIGPGTHNVDIYYLKDEATVSGQDAGWVDELVLTPITSAPVVTSASITAYENTALKHQIIATNAPTSYSAVGLPSGLLLSTSTGLIYGSTSQVGSFPITVNATNDFGTGSATVTLVVGSLSEGLAAAIDASALTISTAGNQPWRPQALYSHDGSDAARSGAIQDLQSSEMSTTITGPAKLTFYWGISSEADYDYLRFYIDNVQQEAISGEVGWTLREHLIPAGTHTLKWAYIKDDFVRSGLDSGFVDEFHAYPDADNDGVWADEEAAFGTSDTNASEKPFTRLTSVTITGTTLEFPSVIGKQYRVQYSADLQTWTSVSITATSTLTTWTDTGSSAAVRRFYRVVTP
jgi:subtilisin-like proprotein convertase family protein